MQSHHSFQEIKADTEILAPSWKNYSCTFICQAGRPHSSHCCQFFFLWLFLFILLGHMGCTAGAVSLTISLYTFLPCSLTAKNCGLTMQYHDWTLCLKNNRNDWEHEQCNHSKARVAGWWRSQERSIGKAEIPLHFQERPHLNHLRNYVKIQSLNLFICLCIYLFIYIFFETGFSV